MTVDHSIDAARARMSDRGGTFMGLISPELKAREDELPRGIAIENASVRTKLRKVYRVIDELAAVRAPYTACRAGCADCCRMNVQISAVEAEHIERATGLTPVRLSASIAHADGTFSGTACPFLSDQVCSIYDDRPAVCRHHASFDVDAYWCEPSRNLLEQVTMVRFDGAMAAIRGLVELTGSPVADIRDFFPNTRKPPVVLGGASPALRDRR